jgi:hypothetical protein
MNTLFNFNRFGLLLRRYFVERLHGELIYWGIFAIMFMFFRNNIVSIVGMIFVAGLFFAARFSREIHSRTNGINYFMIPATQLEKLTLTFLITIVYYFAMMMLVYVIGNLVGTALNNLLAGIDYLSNNLRLFHHTPLNWQLFASPEHQPLVSVNGAVVSSGMSIGSFLGLVWTFVISQTVFALGGIYFKRSQPFKTILALTIIGFVYAISIILGLKLIAEDPSLNLNTINQVATLKNIFETIGRIFFLLFPPFLWIVSYFRLTEKEI